MRSFIKFIKIILIILYLFPLISSELFTALVHLEKLLNTEKQIVALLEQYLSSEEERITRLRNLKQNYDELHSISSQNAEHFLENPINAYILVKRLTTDLEKITHKRRDDYFESLQMNTILPSNEDLKGSAEAIFRIQDIYKLETKSLADGYVLINKTRKSDEIDQKDKKRLKMSYDDCFELGVHAYLKYDFYHTVIWMEEAFNRLKIEKPYDIESEIKILDFLAFALYETGNLSRALELTKQLIILSPEDERALNNIKIYEKELEQYNLENENNGEFIASEQSDSSSFVPQTEREISESLCRGENRLNDSVKSKLVCFHLDTSKIPFLRYTRIKVEEAFKRPQIVVFYDILSDSEIEVIKSLSEPKLSRAVIVNPITGVQEAADYRISKSAWLQTNDHPLIAKVERRIGYVTGLEMMSAELLQVVNYGIGGHYDPHLDFSRPGEESESGNRIATWLNYMSDVEAGGATVFPAIGITIWPKKSSAVFWYNLHKSGDGDLMTRHAACPVLIGSKWVSTKWFREWGQEFRKPCSQNINQFNIIQNV